MEHVCTKCRGSLTDLDIAFGTTECFSCYNKVESEPIALSADEKAQLDELAAVSKRYFDDPVMDTLDPDR